MKLKVLRHEVKNRMHFFLNYETIPLNMDYFHFHEMREFCFVEKGHSEIITEEGRFIADGPFVMQNPEGMLHCQKNSSDAPYSRWITCFEPESVRAAFDGNLPDKFFLVQIPQDTSERFCAIFDILADTINEARTESTDEFRTYLIAAMYAELIPLIPQKMQSSGVPSNQKRIFDICRYIDNHFAERLTLDILSREFFIGRATLVREFRNVLGMTVGDYIQNVRVSKAKRMLMMGMPVAEISDACGYASPSYFVQVFRRAENVTPAAYAERCRRMVRSEKFRKNAAETSLTDAAKLPADTAEKFLTDASVDSATGADEKSLFGAAKKSSINQTEEASE